MSQEVDVVVVGAGIIGLTTATALAGDGRRVIVIERNSDIARETTSRNSEVIHAGIYYPPGSLKATFCVAGRKALYVNAGFTTRIRGRRANESRATLGFLYRHMEHPDFQCRFRWRAHSIAMWDNRCVQHLATWDYHPEVRHGYRVALRGDRPV